METDLRKQATLPYSYIGVASFDAVHSFYTKYEQYPDDIKYILIQRDFDNYSIVIKQLYKKQGLDFSDFLKGALLANFLKAVNHSNTLVETNVQLEYKESTHVEDFKKGAVLQGVLLTSLISDMIKEKKQLEDLQKSIKETVKTHDYEAKRLARTETTKTVNDACLGVFKEAGINYVKWSNAPERIQFIKAKGKRVTRVCQHCKEFATGGINNDGIYPINRLPSPCPAHPNCRCTLVPIVNKQQK